jgi:hypothetical protein
MASPFLIYEIGKSLLDTNHKEELGFLAMRHFRTIVAIVQVLDRNLSTMYPNLFYGIQWE